MIISHSDQGLADGAADKGTYMPGDHRGDTVDRTLHLSTRQLPAGVFLLSLGLGKSCLGFEQCVTCGLQTEVTYHAVVSQLYIAFVVHLGSGQFGLGRLTVGNSHL